VSAAARPGLGPRAALAGGALLFSTGGLAIKLCTLPAWQVACLRSAVAALALGLLAPAAWRGWSLRTLVVALPYAATGVLFTLANRSTTAASAIFLQDTAPLWVMLLGPRLLAERIGRAELGLVAVIAAGSVLLFLGTAAPGATAPDPALGNALAAVAGLAWALTLIGMRWLATGPAGSREAALAAALAGNLLAALATAPLALPLGAVGAGDWLIVGWLGVFQIACAYLLITAAMTRVPALEASLLLLLEPVLATLWAWLVLGERAGPLAIAGGALILAATVARAWQSRG
jgi:drug/metabolite transporter (DMT)-like permease